MNKIQDLVKKGQNLMDESKFEDALECFKQALLLEPDDPDLLNHVGVALKSLGRYVESAKYFEKSLQIDPRDKNAS